MVVARRTPRRFGSARPSMSADVPAGAPRRSPDDRAVAPAADGGTGRVEIIALAGIPEIVPGDDLSRLIGDALERTAGLLPLRPDDVLVVTQKVVSKAEGAIIDLTAVEPRPEAIAFGERWDRDPRGVEVVLREARRVVRMERGVIITETEHGFVCANGGIDASNVGPASGSIVTILPHDPDASATGIRAAIRERFGVDVPVIVSDSFGRPWRWGITDVAIGVSGLVPIEDLRGTPDADGRVMKSTIRASADEIASAAELALGKLAGRPVAVVRGARPLLGEGSIRDALMPREFDLFA
jgi:coenzyme F420-0:L-glutamate ligase/coenzyme F420-1:gamma-L-glutamate ligase